jgi:subtilisin family serine protease
MKVTAIVLFAPLLLAPLVSGQTTPPSYMVDTDPSDLNGVLARHHLALNEVIRTGIYRVTGPSGESQTDLLKDLGGDHQVTGAEADRTVDTPEAPKTPVPFSPSLALLAPALNDHSIMSYYGATVRGAYVNQQAAGMIEMPQALARFGSGNTIVAVIDTGVDPTHPALVGALVNGYDFTRNLAGPASELLDLDQSTVAILEQSTVAILEHKNSPAILNQSTVAILEQSTVAILEGAKLPSDFGHGTMVSGLIHLVAPGVKIMPLKAFSADGSSQLSNIVQAVYYAVDHNAKVINMSFAMTSPSTELTNAIAYAKAHGVICVASAGNDGREETTFPAATGGVIGVGSTSQTDLRSVFSNYGDSASVAAPGEALITTYPGNNYAGVWGTSFSSALVSGTAALMFELNTKLSHSSASDALGKGKQIHQNVGARLDEIPTLVYLLTNHDD